MKIFVYGTLKSDGPLFKSWLEDVAENIQPATLKGNLYQAPGVWFPLGKLVGPNLGIIKGEIMEVPEDMQYTLDMIENGYVRMVVRTEEGDVVHAYHYDGEVSDCMLIEGGEWINE